MACLVEITVITIISHLFRFVAVRSVCAMRVSVCFLARSVYLLEVVLRFPYAAFINVECVKIPKTPENMRQHITNACASI